jgi:hypothetical protein
VNTVTELNVQLKDAEVIYQLSACQLLKNDYLCVALVELD